LKEWLEETGAYPSVSMMFRALARERMEETEEQEATASIDPEEITNAVNVAMSDVTERLERIEDGLAHIDTAVQHEEDIEDLANDIVRELPVATDIKDLEPVYDIVQDRAHDDTIDYHEYARRVSTAAAWAKYLDADVNRVRRALARAVEWYPDVKYGHTPADEDNPDPMYGDERRYYRTSKP
jgi:hypothetical protein